MPAEHCQAAEAHSSSINGSKPGQGHEVTGAVGMALPVPAVHAWPGN
jgi:hypothetical protein